MKQNKTWMVLAIGVLAFTACKKDKGEHGDAGEGGQVYTMSNSAKGNTLIAYHRAENGKLTWDSSYATGGFGTGAGLGSQGSVVLTPDNIVLVANAGSNSISSFKITGHGAKLVSTVSSGGITPISITEYNHAVVVLNGGGDGNITGFELGSDGKLLPVANSTKPLSSKAAGPAQVSFVNGGKALVVTEKSANTILSYNSSGIMHTLTSAHPTPFGFAVGSNGKIIVSEAAGGAAGASTVSSYHVDNNGVISLVTGPVSANQTAACWVVLTDNEKFAYAANTGSNDVSSFSVNDATGSIKLLTAVAAASGTAPADAALSDGSKYLYVLTAGSNTLNVYSVGSDGGLNSVQTVPGVFGSGVGLAAE